MGVSPKSRSSLGKQKAPCKLLPRMWQLSKHTSDEVINFKFLWWAQNMIVRAACFNWHSMESSLSKLKGEWTPKNGRSSLGTLDIWERNTLQWKWVWEENRKCDEWTIENPSLRFQMEFLRLFWRMNIQTCIWQIFWSLPESSSSVCIYQLVYSINNNFMIIISSEGESMQKWQRINESLT